MTLALAIKEDASAEDKVSPQFVVAIAEILPGVTWDHTEHGTTRNMVAQVLLSDVWPSQRRRWPRLPLARPYVGIL